MGNRPSTPAEAWHALQSGNQRFVRDKSDHPNQDVDRRTDLASGQVPFAALFGCSDSRLSAEIIFDVGLGDLFVVRNAGQVIAETILGSLEYAVEVLEVPLILVLGHDSCGAISAAIEASNGQLASKGQFIQHLVAAIQPTVTAAKSSGITSTDLVSDLNVKNQVETILVRSKLIRERVEEGKLALVGANYRLAAGEVQALVSVGNI